MTNSNVFTTPLKSIVSKQITTFLLVFTLIFSFYTEGSSQCPCTDCRCTDSLELVKLYNATNGANWRLKWILTNPLTSWSGVQLANGRVKVINLASYQLSGQIPNLNLPNLQYLVLHSNKLTGLISNFNLPNLQYLDLRANQLTGAIPDFNLPNLLDLRLNINQLFETIHKFRIQRIHIFVEQYRSKMRPNP